MFVRHLQRGICSGNWALRRFVAGASQRRQVGKALAEIRIFVEAIICNLPTAERVPELDAGDARNPVPVTPGTTFRESYYD